jgi:hypothetical protein
MNKLVKTVIDRVMFFNEELLEKAGASVLGVETDGNHARILWQNTAIWNSWDDIDGFCQDSVIYPDVPQATVEDVMESINAVLPEVIEEQITLLKIIKAATKKKGPK